MYWATGRQVVNQHQEWQRAEPWALWHSSTEWQTPQSRQMYHQSEQWKLQHYRYLYYIGQQNTHYKTPSTQSGQFLVTQKSARHRTRPHYFYCPSPDFSSRCADYRADTIGHFNCLSVGNKQLFCLFGEPALCPQLANCFRRYWSSVDTQLRWKLCILYLHCRLFIPVYNGANIIFKYRPQNTRVIPKIKVARFMAYGAYTTVKVWKICMREIGSIQNTTTITMWIQTKLKVCHKWIKL